MTAILTPLLMVIIMVAGDFLGMALTTDKVQPSRHPNVWRIGSLTIAGIVMGLCELPFCVFVLAVGLYFLGLGIAARRTLSFIATVFGNQAAMYLNRERRHLWSSRPSGWLALSSVADIAIASFLADGRGHDTTAGARGGRQLCCGARLYGRRGQGEGPAVRSPEDRLAAVDSWSFLLGAGEERRANRCTSLR